MGRYLCKSGEYEQRNQNQQLVKTMGLIETQLKQRDEEYESSLTKINVFETQTAEQQQQISALKGQLSVLDDERSEHLKRLQESSQCETRLATVIQDFELEKQLHRKEKGVSIELKNQLDEVNNQNKQQDKIIIRVEKDLKSTSFELSNTIKAYEDQAEELAQIQVVIERHQAALKENKELQSTIKLIQSENDTIKSRLKQSTDEFSQLQQKCSELSEDSLGFADKLTSLNSDKHELNRIIESMTIEKNDYLGRLRAISSVVDVVGTEAIHEAE